MLDLLLLISNISSLLLCAYVRTKEPCSILDLQSETVVGKFESTTTTFLIMLPHLPQHRFPGLACFPITQSRRIALGPSASDPLKIAVAVASTLFSATLKVHDRLPTMKVDAAAAA
jgi:hypothetical protein